MRVNKLCVSAQANGLVPAGRYFAKLAQGLRTANEADSARQDKLDARYRRTRSAGLQTRGPTSASEHEAVMH